MEEDAVNFACIEAENKAYRMNKLEEALAKTIAKLIRKCLRCDHEWQLRVPAEPKMCPRCKSLRWNEERKK
jgi:predicted Zn-ribbon and HTH transcriptional regulator